MRDCPLMMMKRCWYVMGIGVQSTLVCGCKFLFRAVFSLVLFASIILLWTDLTLSASVGTAGLTKSDSQLSGALNDGSFSNSFDPYGLKDSESTWNGINWRNARQSIASYLGLYSGNWAQQIEAEQRNAQMLDAETFGILSAGLGYFTERDLQGNYIHPSDAFEKGLWGLAQVGLIGASTSIGLWRQQMMNPLALEPLKGGQPDLRSRGNTANNTSLGTGTVMPRVGQIGPLFDNRNWGTVRAERNAGLLNTKGRDWTWEHFFLRQRYYSNSDSSWLRGFGNSYANTFLRIPRSLNSSLGNDSTKRWFFRGGVLGGGVASGAFGYMVGTEINNHWMAPSLDDE